MPADLVTRLLLQNQEFDRNLKESRRQIQTFQKGVSAAAATVRSFVGGFVGMAGISIAFMDITQKSMQFEKALSSLRSLTGVSAKEMDFFKQQAIKMGSTSTQTASQVVDAFKLIGSQKSELLKNKEALAEVTNQAIILAEAAEMEVPAAAKALTGSLNQMEESANKAGEYINILAAASQAGSANIPYLTKAIEKAGGAASSVGVKYNELVAAIEAIAPKMSEASEAGTNLRNIFLTLESNSDKKLKPSVVGLSKALENLADKNLDATQMTKMFGKESVTAALAIVNAKDNYLELVDTITGTNKAIEQQKINNDNLAGSINGIASSWEGFILTINKTNGPLKEAADLLSSLLRGATNLIKSEEDKQNEIIEQSVKKRKDILDRDIRQWENLGLTKKQAVEKVLETYPEKYDIPDSNALKQEELKLKELEERLKKIKEDDINVNIGKTALKSNPMINMASNIPQVDALLDKLPSTNINMNSQAATAQVEQQVAAQKDLVNSLRIQNQLYDTSVDYLNEELETIKKIKEKEGKPGSTSVTDEMRQQWKKQDSQDRRNLSFQESSDTAALSIRAELQKKINEESPIPVFVKPEFVESDETSDISGSIEDYQKKIQDVTLAYNEATTDSLRALYAKQKEDLEKHLEEMTDTSQGMIDITNELNNLVQSGVSLGFESLGEALASGDAGEATRNMLMGMMDMLKQFGEALVAAGIAKIAFDKLLANPFAAIAAGGALIIAVTAAKSALQSAGDYAEGGIIPYNRFTVGDRMTAQVNGGEMILNTGQQAKLFDLLDGGRMPAGNESIQVTGKIIGEGSQLAVILNETAKKQRRGR